MDFEKICMMFTMQEPYYGIILSSMERIPDKTVTDTLCVGRTGNVFKLFYNRDFVDRFNVDTVLELLKHEVIHLCFNHLTIFDDKGHDPSMRKLENIAVDAEANCYIDRSKMQKEVGGIWCEDFGFDKNLGAREYYTMFYNLLNKPQQQQAQNPQAPCNNGLGGMAQQQNNTDSGSDNSQNQQEQSDSRQDESNDEPVEHGEGNSLPKPKPQMQQGIQELEEKTFDSHNEWPQDMEESDIEALREVVETMMLFAAEEVEKSCGQIPGEVAGRIEKLRKKPKPVADWRRYFRRYLGNEFSELIKKSRKRESRRFPDAAGNRHQRKSHILVAIDTSGSVSMPEYMEFFGQIRTLQDKATFHVVECDTRIVHEYDFRGKPNEVLHGGGGTSFEPPIDLFIKNRKKYDALVYFTDGGAYIPDNTPKDTLWVISSRGDHDRKRYKVNGASVVIIPPKTV